MNTAPSTELDAINEMLTTIGETPVSTVDDNGVVDAAIARQILTSISRTVQSRGWHFNTEIDYMLHPATPSKEIILPLNVLRVDTVKEDHDIDVVQRGKRLYNRRKHTYEFDRSLKTDLVTMLAFDELPEPARFYITLRAARVFQSRVVGSTTLDGFSERDEMYAKMVLEEFNGDTKDANILHDSDGVANILRR